MARPRQRHSSLLSLIFVLLYAAQFQLVVCDEALSCGPHQPCPNQSCCSINGWCGYGPEYCGEGCQSHCGAKAACGKYAEHPGQECALNACCSKGGLCGTGEAFCETGCQSNCEQPRPDVPSTNVQKRVIGYWETWNSDKPCGRMGPNEIPVHRLTHLYVSFGYINHAFQITNMDGVEPDLYKNIGQLKARNPSLKIVIVLGGWAFTEPGGPWQSVFPELVCDAANRAKFIKNLMGFLSEYGYDGVDFDWDYPGAEERGGGPGDGENYTLLLKEVREAVEASRREYIVTVTAPSSYWYLSQYDLKGMEKHVDWINLMAYDLHGSWDVDSPVGNRVFSHTNLTEIDQALNLFWRVDINPANVVLGLAFYGRSFELESASCWRPGCRFKGPGAQGRCSRTPGMLAYHEIVEIVGSTGTTPFLDEDAATRYFVYDENNWISYDDDETFQKKIDYANNMGLSGLMIWAIDLDTSNFQALNAVSDIEMIEDVVAAPPFSLVELDKLFPQNMMPQQDAKISYGLINFGSRSNAGEIDPNETGFGLMIIAGESHVFSSLKKRRGETEPLAFLDCPPNVLDALANETQTARVACLSNNVEGCFQVLERGVEGTMIEMPDNCAPNTFARAISLKRSPDQNLPSHLGERAPTSDVFEFSFDFDLERIRRDSSNTKIRVDYSNVRGYWNSIFESGEDIRSASSEQMAKRFSAPGIADWRRAHRHRASKRDDDIDDEIEGDWNISEDFSTPLLWDSTGECPMLGENFEHGFAAHIEGSMDATFQYGFTLVAEIDSSNSSRLDVDRASGFIEVKGDANMTFTAAGIGQVDVGAANQGNPAWTDNRRVTSSAKSMDAGRSGMGISFEPYYKIDYMLATFNDTDGGSSNGAAADFNGHMSARVRTDFGDFSASFPPPTRSEAEDRFITRDDNRITIGDDDILYSTTGEGGRIAMTARLTFGVDVSLMRFLRVNSFTSPLADMSLTHQTLTEFSFFPGLDSPGQNQKRDVESCSEYHISTSVSQDLQQADAIGWGDSEGFVRLAMDAKEPSEGSVCFPSIGPPESQLRARSDLEIPGWNYGIDKQVDPLTYVSSDIADDFDDSKNLKFKCQQDCVSCGKLDDTLEETRPCCGCVNMDMKFVYRDIGDCPDCNDDEGEYPGRNLLISDLPVPRRQVDHEEGEADGDDDDEYLHYDELTERQAARATISNKKARVCGRSEHARDIGRYPAFPQDTRVDFETIDGGRWQDISRYWGNSSSSCSDWAVTDMSPPDDAYIDAAGTQVRAKYQTEHVFEAQIIADFFNQWLDKGEINNQMPRPQNPTPKVPCVVTDIWMFESKSPHDWRVPNSSRRIGFFRRLMYELGSIHHLNRLTILKARPNRMKGAMFTGNQPIAVSTYLTMSLSEQLQAVKDMGMVFNYMNEDKVWTAFCGTYNAIYDLFGEWDTFYANHGSGVTLPGLRAEWKEYVETVLVSMVRRTRGTFDSLEALSLLRIGLDPVRNAGFATHWARNTARNRRSIRFERKCRNMDDIPTS